MCVASGQHIRMHPPATRDRALSLIRAGHNDCEVARRTGVARTTVRDWRRPRYTPRSATGPRLACPRCGRSSPRISFSDSDYAELLAIYLGDGYIVQMGRTFRLRVYLDRRHPGVIADIEGLLRRCFPANRVGVAVSRVYWMTVLSVYSSHLPCLFPQHGPGKKHNRRILLETWQQELLEQQPWPFLRGCIWTDGCSYINRTGPYEYLSYDFYSHSQDILALFTAACDQAGVGYRRYGRYVRIARRESVALMQTHVGVKR